MTTVTATELKINLGKYLDLIDKEDVYITRNGRKIAKLIKEEDDALASFNALFGILADSEYSKATDDELKQAIHEERIRRYESID